MIRYDVQQANKKEFIAKQEKENDFDNNHFMYSYHTFYYIYMTCNSHKVIYNAYRITLS